MQIITSPVACFLLSFQDQHTAYSLHLRSWARYREFNRGKGSTSKKKKGRAKKKTNSSMVLPLIHKAVVLSSPHSLAA